MGNKLYAAYMHTVFSKEFIRDVFNTEDPKEEKLGDAVEIVLGLLEIWDSVPSCIPAKLQGQSLVNEMRRGIECSLIDFCSMEGAKLSTTNRKIKNKNRKNFEDEVPENIEGMSHQNWTTSFLIMKEKKTSRLSLNSSRKSKKKKENQKRRMKRWKRRRNPKSLTVLKKRQRWPKKNRKERRQKTIPWKEVLRKNQKQRREGSSAW